MIALLPKHKGTEKLHADLKKRLAKLEEEGEHVAWSAAHRADPAHVRREGAGQWVLFGPPNAGKSSLLAALTHAHPEIADYPFTTRAPLPGMMPFEDVQVQLVDTPPVATGHTEPYLPNLAQGADGAVVVLDPTADDVAEAFAAVLESPLRGHVWPRARAVPPGASPLLQGRPVLVVATRRDLDDDGTFAALAREAVGQDLPFFAVSATRGDGLDALRPELFRALERIRVYTKEPGRSRTSESRSSCPQARPCTRSPSSFTHDVAAHLKFARIWGHARFGGQQVERNHVLADGDVVELHA